jgi:hypothetical protein
VRFLTEQIKAKATYRHIPSSRYESAISAQCRLYAQTNIRRLRCNFLTSPQDGLVRGFVSWRTVSHHAELEVLAWQHGVPLHSAGIDKTIFRRLATTGFFQTEMGQPATRKLVGWSSYGAN